MNVFRSPQNPIIRPEDINPSSDDFEVIGVFNTGVTRFDDQIILLLRVAERPVNKNADFTLAAVYDVARKQPMTIEFRKDNKQIDFLHITILLSKKYINEIDSLFLMWLFC